MKFTEELAAILRHIIIVGTLLLGAIGIGFLTELGRKRIPGHAREFGWIETVDTWVILILVCLFGAYMVLVVAAGLWKGVVRAWTREDDDKDSK